MKGNQWARLLAYVTGLVNQELLLQNEFLLAENRILRAHLPARLRLSDPERRTLAEIGKRLGRKALAKVAGVAKPDTILAWYRRLIASKFDGSQSRSYPGRPRISAEVEELVVRFARENSGWGYDCIVGALANLGHQISDQTVGNILRRHNVAPAPKRSQTTTWEGIYPPASGRARGNRLLHRRGADLARLGDLLRSVLPASGDPTRKLGGHHAPPHRGVDDTDGSQRGGRGIRISAPLSLCAARPRCQVLRGLPKDAGNRRCKVPATASAQPESECLRGAMGALGEKRMPFPFILFGEGSLRRALKNFCEHYHEGRNHQDQTTFFPAPVRLEPGRRRGIRCRKRLGGLLRYYSRAA
jgi:putative transposase